MSENVLVDTDYWADDHLGRRDEANYLSNYLAARYAAKMGEAGFVLAVNADWGMGKSFMIERWGKDLHAAGHPVVSFNAWENDFTAEPLVAFIAELDQALGPYFAMLPAGTELRKKLIEQAKAALVPTLKVAGLALLKQAAGLGYDQVADMYRAEFGGEQSETGKAEKSGRVDAAAESNDTDKFDAKDLKEKLAKAVEESLKSHNNTKLAIKAFKDRLTLLIEHLRLKESVQLPMCVFIDELDRCRPDYAISLLEGIKHLFGVPGIHFIVATNLSELAHSVRVVYGPGFAADRYLKRFFDMEYSLPEPEGAKFAEELMTPLANLSSLRIVTGFESIYNLAELPAKGIALIFQKNAAAFELTLRDQQQVAKILEAALLSLGNHHPVHIHFLVFLAMLYQKNSQVYRNVARAKNTSESTGIASAYPQNGEGFRVPRSNESGGENVIQPLQVASVYFGFLAENSMYSRRHAAAHEFPELLYWKLEAQESPALIGSYVEIVRRAGRFSR